MKFNELYIFIQGLFDFYSNYDISDKILEEMEDKIVDYIKYTFSDIKEKKYFRLLCDSNEARLIHNVNVYIDPEFEKQLIEFYPEKFI